MALCCGLTDRITGRGSELPGDDLDGVSVVVGGRPPHYIDTGVQIRARYRTKAGIQKMPNIHYLKKHPHDPSGTVDGDIDVG